MSTPSGANSPYKIVRSKGKFLVKNNMGETKATFDTYDRALRYQNALYANVPGAAKRAAKVKFTGKAPQRIPEKSDATADALSRVPSPHPFVPRPKATTSPAGAVVAAPSNECLVCGMGQSNPIHAGETPDLKDPNVVMQVMLQNRSRAEDEEQPYATAAASGAMVAFMMPQDIARQLAVPGGEPENMLHITLAYLPEAPEGEDLNALHALVAMFAALHCPIDGTISGVGLFTAGPEPVTYASPDIPALPALRSDLVQILVDNGYDVSTEHGYTPHITLAYKDVIDEIKVPNLEFTLGYIAVCVGDSCARFAMTNPDEMEIEAAAKTMRMANGSYPISDQKSANSAWKLRNHSKDYSEDQVVAHIRKACSELGLSFPGEDKEKAHVSVTDPVQGVELDAADAPVDTVKAFVTEVNGKTLITAPVSTSLNLWEKALTPNEHIMWLQGRLVGAEEPNRNGAFWSTADLEFGEPTVRFGPLNWLHEARHVVGVLADSKMVPGTKSVDLPNGHLEAAEATTQPHIAVAAAVWRWLYAEEAAVLEMASDSGRLFLSMECASRQVSCVGDDGCGETVGYMEYLSRTVGCDHLRERSGVRRFVEPTFLGAATIVPPARPGWAGADAQIMREAASYAERTYEQMGSPADLSASEVERILSEVLTFAKV